MHRILDAVHLVLKVALGLLVAGLIIPVTMQVLSRSDYVPRYIWTEEIARFCFVWMIMIGAMCAVRDGTHFDLEILPESANPKIERAKRIFVHLMVSLVAVIFVWYGWQFLLFGWYQTSEIASLPMNWMFVAWPLMGVVTLLFMAEKVMIELRRPLGEVA
ncbi:TRAP transporter small permease [Aurantimonas coralicida]|uniref:TRAP transporter small permease n=1 Tax=Aurantimonas coralicida TaxID=182270 RepID=UPI00165DE192|nr:TRAP transporter small permease [Aurantimonas coralicida]MCC4298841.1 TRAP transporter small permease [Aurantimonas coralicida]MCD1643379.1 TRAP transporter small permease [Aurantimonas coralicida]MDE0924005.1 TRAP transporter small permease [Aurantimonas coralicida]